MLADIKACHVAGFKPSGLVGHVVINRFAVDDQIFKHNVLHFAFAVVTGKNGKLRIRSIVGDVFEIDILNPTTGSGTILFVVKQSSIRMSSKNTLRIEC